MKRLFYTLAMVSVVALSSCGGGADAAGDATKLCECMDAAKADPSKAEECATMAQEFEDKYKDDAPSLVKFATAYSECQGTAE